jgi:hypothetical protein
MTWEQLLEAASQGKVVVNELARVQQVHNVDAGTREPDVVRYYEARIGDERAPLTPSEAADLINRGASWGRRILRVEIDSHPHEGRSVWHLLRGDVEIASDTAKHGYRSYDAILAARARASQEDPSQIDVPVTRYDLHGPTTQLY